MTASPRRWQQFNEVQSGSNTQEATEAYEEEDKTADIDPLCADHDEPDNKTQNCLNLNLIMDQSSPPRNILEETSRWTGEKRAKVVASPPTSEAAHYKQMDDPRDTEEFWDVFDDPEQLNEVQERLALYRIKAHELFWEGKDLDIAQLKKEYSPDTLHDEGYFQPYEVNREWYFNPEYCKRSALDDYQRLVLRKDYYSHLAHIDENVPEDEVVVLIRESVRKILSKQLTYVDYIRKKIEVAKEIGVIP